VPHERASIDFPKIGTRISGLHIRTCKRGEKSERPKLTTTRCESSDVSAKRP
jgi:hypothetical protein